MGVGLWLPFSMRTRLHHLASDRGHFFLMSLPNNGCPYWCMGDTYHALDDIENADLHYHKAVEIDPDDPTAMQNLERWLAIKQG